ncbi:MAG: alpha/beta hydrolase [Rhodoglobus sp.]|nr:alpha/beta hydrolase [Rhodoglobus sp.]
MKHVEIEGAGETLVFLHGGNVAGWMWGEQVPAFADHHILVPDLPGFGESNDEEWVSIAATADNVADLIAGHAHGARAHVVGLSLGSSVAIELAARHPDRVASLFLASAQVAPPLRRDMIAARVLLSFWNQRGFWTTLARSYGLAGDDAELFVNTGLGIRRETAVTIYDEVSRGLPSEVLARVAAPTLVVAGEKDSRAITDASLVMVRRGIPNTKTAIAPGMHHQWNIENVELFNAALRAWLDARKVASGLGGSI